MSKGKVKHAIRTVTDVATRISTNNATEGTTRIITRNATENVVFSVTWNSIRIATSAGIVNALKREFENVKK